jgi:hypothetical protein
MLQPLAGLVIDFSYYQTLIDAGFNHYNHNSKFLYFSILQKINGLCLILKTERRITLLAQILK